MTTFYSVLEQKLGNLIREKYLSILHDHLNILKREEDDIFENIKPRKRKEPLQNVRNKMKPFTTETEKIQKISALDIIHLNPLGILGDQFLKLEFCFFVEFSKIENCKKLDVFEQMRRLADYLSEKHDFAIWNEHFEYNFRRSMLFYAASKERGCIYPGPSLREINAIWPEKITLRKFNF